MVFTGRLPTPGFSRYSRMRIRHRAAKYSAMRRMLQAACIRAGPGIAACMAAARSGQLSPFYGKTPLRWPLPSAGWAPTSIPPFPGKDLQWIRDFLEDR